MSRRKWLIPVVLAVFTSACAVQVSGGPDGDSDLGEGAQSLGDQAPPGASQPGGDDGVHHVVSSSKPTPDPWGGTKVDPDKPTPDPWRPAPAAPGTNDDSSGNTGSNDTTPQSGGTTQTGH